MSARSTATGVLVAIAGCALLPCAHGACDAAPERDQKGYEAAASRVTQLPEYRAWLKGVAGAPDVKAAFGFSMDKQSLLRGRCFWEVTVYESHPTHMVRWNTFFVAADDETILVDDITGGDPLTLAQWRSRGFQ